MPRTMNESDSSEYHHGHDYDDYSVRGFLTMLFKRGRVALYFFLGVVLVAAIGILLSAPTYEVTASILVKEGRAEVPLILKESPQLIMNQVTEEDLNSEIAILKSRELIEDVLQALGVDESWRSEESWLDKARSFVRRKLGRDELPFFDQMVLNLQNRLNVVSITKSNIIQASYRSDDPDWAFQVVQTLTEQYLEHRAAVYQTPHVISFFQKRKEASASDLNTAEKSLQLFLDDAGLTMVRGQDGLESLAAQKQQVLRRVGQLMDQFADAQVEVQEREETVAALKARIAEEPERLASSDRYNLDPAIEEIEKRVMTLQLERDALIQNFKPNNKQVKDIDTQIALAEKRLREAQERAGSINRTELNQVHQDLKAELLRAEANLEGAHARYKSLQKQVATYRRELSDLNQKGFALERLRRDVDAAEESYLLYQKKYQEATISAAMDQQEIVNVGIAEPAKRPLIPVGPSKTLRLFLAIVLGAVGALAIVVTMEFFDHSFTTAQDVERRLGISHLASIPEVDSV